MQLRLLKAVRDERRGWGCGDYYCGRCSSTGVSATGPMEFDRRTQLWRDGSGDIDRWYCSDCADEASVDWQYFVQWMLWGEENDRAD